MKKTIMNKLVGQTVLQLALILSSAVMIIPGQTADEVESFLRRAKEAEKAEKYKEAVAAYERAIELDPHNYKAHSGLVTLHQNQFIKLMFKDGELVSEEARKEIGDKMKAYKNETEARYEQLAQKYPDKAVYKLILASLAVYEPVKRLSYLEAAERVEPNNLDVLSNLARFEMARGDSRKANHYYKLLSQPLPQDIDIVYDYASTLKDIDKKLYREKTREFIKRFPTDQKAAMALYWLAADAESESEKLAYCEELKRNYPPSKYGWSMEGMRILFGIYTRTAPDKALALAQEMVDGSSSAGEKKSWQAFVDYQSKLNQAASLINEKKTSDALALLENVKPPQRFNETAPFYLLKAKAQVAAGQIDKAFNELAKDYVKDPDNDIRSRLEELGKQLGKDRTQVEKDIQTLVVAQAKAIKDFSLTRFDNGKNVSLADFRGKVILLNFWYPMCGPCHSEAPYLQKLIEKYGKDKFVILSPSVHPKEDSMVMPYFQNTGFDFIPLKVPDEEFASREYQARGFPTNYLIDKQGGMIFNLGVVYQERMEEVELMIEMALAQKP